MRADRVLGAACVAHVAVSVADLTVMMRFYEAAGFDIVHRTTLSIPDGAMAVAHLQNEAVVRLELIAPPKSRA